MPKPQKKKTIKKAPKRKPSKKLIDKVPIPDALLATRNSYAFIWEED